MRPLTSWFKLASLPAPEGEIHVRSFQADSRKIQQGDVFVAIAGAAQNGWDYVQSAIDNGAVAVLSDVQQKEVPVAFIQVENARIAYAKLCAAMHPKQPQHLVAVTGTNGKTSVAEFYRQLWSLAGEQAASIGTLGVMRTNGEADKKWPSLNTSPAPDLMHQVLDDLAQQNVQHVAIEASSHGLDQHRIDGVHIKAAAFTNLTQDHLDYHHNMDAYFAAKARLFGDFDAAAVVNADDAYGQKILQQNKEALGYGRQGTWLQLLRYEATHDGLRFTLQYHDKQAEITAALYGSFQIENVMAAMGLAMQTGMSWKTAIALLPQLKGVRGRMEKVAQHASGAPVFIDYAHTPDALKHLLISLRAHCVKKLHVVFGCGGDRDTIKRSVMGAIADEFADSVIVTDDNPRSEDPEAIRQQILAAAPHAIEIAGREAAIGKAVSMLQSGDVLVVAGKGHETYQIIGEQTVEFNDAQKIKEALGAL